MFRLTIKSNGQIIDVKHGSRDALKEMAKYLREYYRKTGYDYKVSVSRREYGANI